MPRKQRATHYDTPIRAKLQGIHEYLLDEGIVHDPRNLFKKYGVSERAGYRIIRKGASTRTRHHTELIETRGRRSKITGEQVREADRLLQEDELQLEGKRLTWEQVAMEVGADVVGRTMHNVLRAALNYEKCLACVKGWLADPPMQKRVEYAHIMLAKYPKPEDWYRVRFSDEVHFSYGPDGKLRIIRQPGTRYRWDCIQHRDAPAEKDRKRLHCWAAVGYNFKSDIIFYEVPGNSNGKMTHQVYINSILEPVVKPWPERGDDFVLEEDGDSRHGTGRTRNAFKKWKEDHRLEHYFNCSSSPDLAPIENSWQPTKQHIKKYPHWDEASLKALICEGWATVSQEFLNERVRSMPQRLKDVISAEGAMTGH